jgi:hypothetical protein
MATAKQIAANRRNAQRSTGPRTAAGRSVSSRNTLRHGLSLPQEKDAATKAAINELAQLMAVDHSNNQKLIDVEEAAAALLDLMRIRKVRNEMLAAMDLATATPDELQRLLAIDRYESRARTRRRRASAKLEQDG